MLSDDVPVYHQQNTRRRSPSCYRRQERRKGAQTKAAEESGQTNSDVVAAAAEEVTETSAVEVVESKIDNCELCDFKTDRKNGLEIHMRKKHAVLEQLDGNNSSESDDDIEDNNNYELSESYWRTGYIEWNDIDLYENVLKAMEQNFWRNKVKKKELIEEANETRMKRLNKKFMDPIFGVYPVYYCNVKSTNLI